jgi:formylglycine-generating enzyme required for sulfatase activity
VAAVAGLPIFLLLVHFGEGFPLLNPTHRELLISREYPNDHEATEMDFPDMVRVKGGRFKMGGPLPGSASSLPIHTVELSDFAISRYEISFAQYDRFCVDTNRHVPPDQGFTRSDRPATCVNWYDALEYCNWLSLKQGRKPCYTIDKGSQDPDNKNDYDENRWTVHWDRRADGYRLPTEAEWEYAARGGEHSKGFVYSGGNDLDKVAWYYNNAGRYPLPVGHKAPNELGLYDMSGNAYEWNWDWSNGTYSWCEEIEHDPIGISTGSLRIVRGGSCFFDEAGALVIHRKSTSPYSRLPYLGFRIVSKEVEP